MESLSVVLAKEKWISFLTYPNPNKGTVRHHFVIWKNPMWNLVIRVQNHYRACCKPQPSDSCLPVDKKCYFLMRKSIFRPSTMRIQDTTVANGKRENAMALV